MESEKVKLIQTESRGVAVMGWGWGEAGQSVQTSSYKMSKF